MKNELKRYIKEINKGLHLPHKMKKRITTELLSEIYGRIDDGEELNSVLTSIGTPQELVEELEANYEHEYVQLFHNCFWYFCTYHIFSNSYHLSSVYSSHYNRWSQRKYRCFYRIQMVCKRIDWWINYTNNYTYFCVITNCSDIHVT